MLKYAKKYFTIDGYYSSFDYQWDQAFSFAGESHNFWEIVFVVSGSTEITEDAQIYRLYEGDMVAHAPSEFHKIRSAEGTSPHVLVLSFHSNGELPENLRSGVFKLSKQEREEYQALFHRIHQFYCQPSSGCYAGQECTDSLAAFLIRLSENYTAKEQLASSHDSRVYIELVDTMTQNLHANLTLEELSKRLHISVSYIKLLFNRYAGISPKAYYGRLRCTEAIRLLQQGLSASEVSQCMNFSSPNYFSVFFKRMTGLPPATYIRQENNQ